MKQTKYKIKEVVKNMDEKAFFLYFENGMYARYDSKNMKMSNDAVVSAFFKKEENI